MAFAKHNGGTVLLAKGMLEAALIEIQGAITLAENIGALWNMPCMYADLALANLALDDADRAYQQANTGLDYAQRRNASQFQLACAVHALARVETARAQYDPPPIISAMR